MCEYTSSKAYLSTMSSTKLGAMKTCIYVYIRKCEHTRTCLNVHTCTH